MLIKCVVLWAVAGQRGFLGLGMSDRAHAISSSWNAVISASSRSVTATNMSWNGNLQAGASTSSGLQGKGSGSGKVASCTAT